MEIIINDCGDGYPSAGPKGGSPKEFIIGSSPEVALKNFAGWLYDNRRTWQLKYEFARRNGGAAWPACPVCGREYGLYGQNLGDFPIHGGAKYEAASDEEVLRWAEEVAGDPGSFTCDYHYDETTTS